MKSIQLRELIEEYRAELVYDFRRFYGLSIYEIIRGSISIREFWDLVQGLLGTPGTKIRAEYFDVEEWNSTDYHLVNVFNGIIASMDAKPSAKKKHFIKTKKPKNRNQPEKKKMTLEDRARIKVAVAPVNEEIFDDVNQILFHIDKTNTVRKCRAGGEDCSASKYDKHFKTIEDANNFKGDSNGSDQNS